MSRSHRRTGPLVPAVIAFVLFIARFSAAQEHQHSAPEQPAQVDHTHHMTQASGGLFDPRDGSGTSWLPEKTPMYGHHAQAGSWELMWHGTVFVQFINESAEEHRGAHQTGSINWGMFMARRHAGAGRAGLRTMVSLEPWTVGGCGYPDLLATGETCDGDTIHDRQHPHDLFMEIAGEYDRPIGRGIRWQIYGGPVGEPALGPVAFPHRLSAMSNPIAPITHHWLDATHITFGVVTTGLSAARWKAEVSAFNGREPDENRTDIDLGPLDSYSGRFTVMPRESLVVQVSGGRLREAERHGGLPPTDLTRVTASAVYHRTLAPSTLWATTIAWGTNIEPLDTTRGWLVESSLSHRDVHAGFLRWESVGKPAHDLHAHETTEIFVVSKLQLGYAGYLRPKYGMQLGLGGSIAGSIVPRGLEARYGGRVSPGVAVFVNLRAAAHSM